MTGYKHILLAYDYSAGNEKVAVKAKRLAQQYQAKLSIVHVLDDVALPNVAYGTVITLDQLHGDSALEQKKAKLIALTQSLDVPLLNCWLIWGNPKLEIVELALQEQVDLVIVGSHGRHGLALLLGSTANSVLQYAGCDVLAVRL
jgi:universal stress protein A